MGVDCILFIVVVFDGGVMWEFECFVFELGMVVIVEIYGVYEFDVVFMLKILLIGVNNCDFVIFVMNIEIIVVMCWFIFGDRMVILEFGIWNVDDV